jgi:hypothetical protein
MTQEREEIIEELVYLGVLEQVPLGGSNDFKWPYLLL